MKNIIWILLLSLLFGCTEDGVIDRNQKINARANEIRHQYFVECMELAARNTRNADDDVSDIINACREASYYLAQSTATGEVLKGMKK